METRVPRVQKGRISGFTSNFTALYEKFYFLIQFQNFDDKN